MYHYDASYVTCVPKAPDSRNVYTFQVMQLKPRHKPRSKLQVRKEIPGHLDEQFCAVVLHSFSVRIRLGRDLKITLREAFE